MRRLIPLLAALAVAATGCGGSTSPATGAIVARTPPDLAAFLRLPVASPSSCPGNVSGSTDGRSSPWVGHVDLSVYLSHAATNDQTVALGDALRADRLVQTVYFESRRQAYEEFERLYTCWASVPRSQTPASYRVILVPSATLDARNALVARLARRRDVDSVSCDPSIPCVNVLESVTASPSP
jgi:hypothetical protein